MDARKAKHPRKLQARHGKPVQARASIAARCACASAASAFSLSTSCCSCSADACACSADSWLAFASAHARRVTRLSWTCFLEHLETFLGNTFRHACSLAGEGTKPETTRQQSPKKNRPMSWNGMRATCAGRYILASSSASLSRKSGTCKHGLMDASGLHPCIEWNRIHIGLS